MENKKNIKYKKQLLYTLFAVGGFLIGWLFFGGRSSSPNIAERGAVTLDSLATAIHNDKEEYTCSMHPQIRQDHPGDCPICGMDLIPVKLHTSHPTDSVPAGAVQMSAEAAALADVQTTIVSRERPVKQVRLYGRIVPDERLMQAQTAYVGGRIERLDVQFTGASVGVGQTLASIYSPALYSAQQELVQAIKMNQPQLIAAAKEKLLLWNITESQIKAVEASGKSSPNLDIKSNTAGVVLSKLVSQGDYVNQGQVLFTIADLSRVWAVFDAFETDLPFLAKGDMVKFTLTAFPGKEFMGRISFVDPVIDSNTRTARVRVEMSNGDRQLKPEMYAMATVDAPLRGYNNEIVVPQTAVLWTGRRSLVYVKDPNIEIPTFMMREVELGPSLGNSYVVMSGLQDGEEIVTDGVFAIDASAQLGGQKSMMNDVATKAGGGHHHMPGMIMSDDDKKTTTSSSHDHHEMNHATTNEDKADANNKSASSPDKHVMFKVGGNCDMCKARIEKAALSVNGVESAVWDKSTKMLHLEFDTLKTSEAKVEKAIAAVGHDTPDYKASTAVYDKLPACCKYRTDGKKD